LCGISSAANGGNSDRARGQIWAEKKNDTQRNARIVVKKNNAMCVSDRAVRGETKTDSDRPNTKHEPQHENWTEEPIGKSDARRQPVWLPPPPPPPQRPVPAVAAAPHRDGLT